MTVQEPPAASDPLARVMLPDVEVTVPPHCDELGAVETVSPVGNVSVNPTPERPEPALGLVIVNVSVLVPPV